jgi:hypothetical protein
MTKETRSLGDRTFVEERCDAGLLRMLKTSADCRPAKKRGRRKSAAIKTSSKEPASHAAAIDPDTK